MKTYALAVIVMSGFLTACSSHRVITEHQLATSTEKPTPNIKPVEPTSIKSWELSGAMSAKGAAKAWSAQINWLQSGANQYQIRLFGPLGGGTVMIEGNKGRITYTDGPKRVISKNPDQLLEKETGLRLPVQNLYYWVRGLPAPGSVTSSMQGPNHTLSTLTQNGYHITYLNYTTINQAELPSKIRLEGHGLLIKLVIKHWKV
jgi:outer membrane lipoprotein LolB